MLSLRFFPQVIDQPIECVEPRERDPEEESKTRSIENRDIRAE